MTKILKRTRKTKADDSAIIKLNSIGISLSTIGELLGVHPTTVSNRLKILGIEPTYTTHAFMEEVIRTLPQETQDWLVTKCSRVYPIRDLIKDLIIGQYNRENNNNDINSSE